MFYRSITMELKGRPINLILKLSKFPFIPVSQKRVVKSENKNKLQFTTRVTRENTYS